MQKLFLHLPWMRVSTFEAARACMGALLGIVTTGFLTRYALGGSVAVPLLVAPMGASAVLLFAVPSSPLARPWSVLGGNMLSAVTGVSVAMAVADPILAAACAIAAAIGTMLACRCLHPPGGAVALTAVLGGTAVTDLGYGFVLWPVGVNSAILLVSALLFNGLTRKPHRHHPVVAADTGALRASASDVESVLRQYDEFIDVTPEMLDHILSDVQITAWQRRLGALVAGDIMSTVPVTVRPDAPLRATWATMQRLNIRAVPVLADDSRVIGIVSRTDFFTAGLLKPDDWMQSLKRGEKRPRRVADIMTSDVETADVQTPVARLVPAMVDRGLHQIPVVNDSGRVVGIVTQADFIAGLMRDSPAQEAARAGLSATV